MRLVFQTLLRKKITNCFEENSLCVANANEGHCFLESSFRRDIRISPNRSWAEVANAKKKEVQWKGRGNFSLRVVVLTSKLFCSQIKAREHGQEKSSKVGSNFTVFLAILSLLRSLRLRWLTVCAHLGTVMLVPTFLFQELEGCFESPQKGGGLFEFGKPSEPDTKISRDQFTSAVVFPVCCANFARSDTSCVLLFYQDVALKGSSLC